MRVALFYCKLHSLRDSCVGQSLKTFHACGIAGCLKKAMTLLEDTGKLIGNGGAASVLRKYRCACVITFPDPAVIDS